MISPMATRDSKAHRALSRRIFALAADRGASIGMSPIDYLIGILEGKYPRFTEEEVAALKTVRNKSTHRRKSQDNK
jgi:hypothetical protein